MSSDDTFEIGRLVAGMHWLDDADRVRVSEFVLQACPGTQWGGAELAKILVAGLGLLREDPDDPYAIRAVAYRGGTGRAMLAVME